MTPLANKLVRIVCLMYFLERAIGSEDSSAVQATVVPARGLLFVPIAIASSSKENGHGFIKYCSFHSQLCVQICISCTYKLF